MKRLWAEPDLGRSTRQAFGGHVERHGEKGIHGSGRAEIREGHVSSSPAGGQFTAGESLPPLLSIRSPFGFWAVRDEKLTSNDGGHDEGNDDAQTHSHRSRRGLSVRASVNLPPAGSQPTGAPVVEHPLICGAKRCGRRPRFAGARISVVAWEIRWTLGCECGGRV